jgi:hypothetical protein
MVLLPLSLFYLENHVCLSRCVQVACVAWRTVMSIVAGVGELVQRTGDGRTGRILGGRTIERSGDTMCSLYRAHETNVNGLSVVWPQNHWDGLTSKPLGRFLSV